MVGSQGLGYDTRTAPCNSQDGFKGHPRVKAPSSRDSLPFTQARSSPLSGPLDLGALV